MANRKRNIQMKFYVTEEEKRLIDKKMGRSSNRQDRRSMSRPQD